VVVLWRPVKCTVTAVPAATAVPVNENVIAFDASETVPLEGSPLTVPRAGVPAVPGGTLIETLASVAVLAVVNVYV
jgi:hypothetical protein